MCASLVSWNLCQDRKYLKKIPLAPQWFLPTYGGCWGTPESSKGGTFANCFQNCFNWEVHLEWKARLLKSKFLPCSWELSRFFTGHLVPWIFLLWRNITPQVNFLILLLDGSHSSFCLFWNFYTFCLKEKKNAFMLHLMKLKEPGLLKYGFPVLLIFWMVVVLQGLSPSYPLYTVQKLVKVVVQAIRQI